MNAADLDTYARAIAVAAMDDEATQADEAHNEACKAAGVEPVWHWYDYLRRLVERAETAERERDELRAMLPTAEEREAIRRHATTRDADYDAHLFVDPVIDAYLARTAPGAKPLTFGPSPADGLALAFGAFPDFPADEPAPVASETLAELDRLAAARTSAPEGYALSPSYAHAKACIEAGVDPVQHYQDWYDNVTVAVHPETMREMALAAKRGHDRLLTRVRELEAEVARVRSERDSLTRQLSETFTAGLKCAKDRDLWRSVAESRPEIGAEDAAAWLRGTQNASTMRDEEGQIRLRDALRAHAAKVTR